jgi:pimeloyl-ACP methyl ester carboxylesterase/predicted glycosyltransferase
MRARYPDQDGFVEVDGVKTAYEVYGRGDRTVVLTPIDPIVHSRAWKAQVPYLSRYARVVALDPRGNGRSDRPVGPQGYRDVDYARDIVAVMDAVGVERGLLVGLCSSAWWSMLVAVEHPERVAGIVSLATWAPFLTPPLPNRVGVDYDAVLDTYTGWQKDSRHYKQAEYPAFLEWFFGELLPEAHSSKQLEDCVAYGLETTAAVLVDLDDAQVSVADREQSTALVQRVRCPVLTIHGTDDHCQPASRSERVAELTGGRHVALHGVGHLPQARHPVVVNRLIREFLDEVLPVPAALRPEHVWTAAATRRRRALFLSSPIGLGHARRDLAVAQALRARRPEVEVDWLTQHPVTELLSRAGEQVHPASAALANESGHIEAESGEHDLHAFQAIRRMDEILVSNFMVFQDLVEQERYDLVVADEAWDVDHFLHENPELKQGTLAWLTDFVGWLPFADGGKHEAWLARDYNAEMVELVARTPWVRDRSLFVGDPEDVVPDSLGDDLPTIRDWTAEHFDFCGYVTGFEPMADADRPGVRAELGYQPDEQVCLVSVGGSGVGVDLLRRVVAAYEPARRLVPGLRMVVVTGPRIDPAAVPAPDGVEVRAYVDGLWRHLAVCDLAVVQGGLTTTMELVAGRRPFLYVPLRHHFEQQFHVRHRLERYGAGRLIDYDETTPDALAAAIADEIGRPVDYRPVAGDGAERVAERLAELV